MSVGRGFGCDGGEMVLRWGWGEDSKARVGRGFGGEGEGVGRGFGGEGEEGVRR